MGTSNSSSLGVLCTGAGGLIIDNATLTASAGKGYNSFGLRVKEDISITNSAVIATSDEPYSSSEAMSTVAGNIRISGGTVSAVGDRRAITVPNGKSITISSGAAVTAQGIRGLAMSQAPNLDAYGGAYYITASESYLGNDPTPYDSEKISTYRYLDIGQKTTAPVVSSVMVPNNGTYLPGNYLDFTVNFHENVLVTGTPYISLMIGTTVRHAMYVSGHGTSALVFCYTVQAGDSDSKGIAVGPLDLDGGTIKDASGNNAVLTLNSIGSTAYILVHTPVATVITGHPSPQTVDAGEDTAFSVAATGEGLTYQWQVDSGSGFSNISNGGVYSSATKAKLFITGATAGMNGYQYRAVVTGVYPPTIYSTPAMLTVNAAPNYTVTANPTSKNFGSLAVGYDAPAAQIVTITNTGNSSVTLTQPTSTNYTIGTLSSTTLVANGTATFTVAPKAGLAVGNYNETLTVSTNQSTKASVELSFSVTTVPNYTVTFNPNGGTVSEASRSVACGTAVGTLPKPIPSGSYSFVGWYTAASGGTQISPSTTVNANVIYYAHWTYIGGGGSGSGGGSSSKDNSSTVIISLPTADKPTAPTQGEIKVPAMADRKGNVTVNITDKIVTHAFDKAYTDAKKSGNEQNGIAVVLRAGQDSNTASHVTINLPKTAQDTIIQKKIVNTIVVVDNPNIKIGMNLATVKEINKQASSDVNITATRADNGKLTEDAKKVIGSRPVFNLNVDYGSGKQVENFGEGNVLVTIPYTLGANEKAENVCAVYVNVNGSVEWLIDSIYDSREKVLRFSTNHFSTYGVGYKQPSTAFMDIEDHWAKENIALVVGRGLFSGTSDYTFSPNMTITRGMFVTVLGRLANADVSKHKQSSFTDVKSNAYYMGYIEWARENSIVKGYGNGEFAPDQSISREQMAVIMSNYAKTIKINLPQVQAENIFADSHKISAYAKDAVKQGQILGILSGKNDNLFDPQGTATRAEVSAVLSRFLKLMDSSETM